MPAWFVTMAVSSPRYLTACWAKLNACTTNSGGSLHFAPSVHGAPHNFTPASGYGGRVVSSQSCIHTRCKGVGIGSKGTLCSLQKQVLTRPIMFWGQRSLKRRDLFCCCAHSKRDALNSKRKHLGRIIRWTSTCVDFPNVISNMFNKQVRK